MAADSISENNMIKGVKQAIAAAFAILGQTPWITTIAGIYSLSIYQPLIYQGKEMFLLVPLIVGVFATWLIVRSRSAMWVIFPITILLAIFVYYAAENFGTSSSIHPINWILSYCVFALFVAMLARLAIEFLDSLG